MPRLYSSDEIVKSLERAGFQFVSQRGGHVKYRKVGQPTRTVIIPAGRNEVPRGTFRSILRRSGLAEAAFVKR